MNWKILAIVFIVIATLETLWIAWSFAVVAEQNAKTSECYYDICEYDYDAYYEPSLDACTCYDKDYEITKEVWMGK